MIWIILAAGLGLANFIAVALLFRRLRGDLNRQLRDMRAEHNSELILRALKEAPETRQQAVQAAYGIGPEPALPTGGPQPVRRKKHLGLFLGGGVAALTLTFGQSMRRAWKSNPLQLVGAAVGLAAAAATVLILLAYAPWENSVRPPSSAPTVAPPPTRTPSPTQPPPGAAQSPSGGPTSHPSPPPSASTTSPPGHVNPPTPSASLLPKPTASAPLTSIVERPKPTARPSRPQRTPPVSSSPALPAPASPPGRPSPEGSPSATATSALCARVAVVPVIGVKVCLPMKGGG